MGILFLAWCLRLKERFNTKLLQLFRDVLADAFNSQDIVFSTLFSESVLVRIHFYGARDTC